MTVENLQLEEREKKPLPNVFTTVIADDRLDHRDLLSFAINQAFLDGGLKNHGEIYQATGVMDLIQKALTGNSGGPVDVVSLDNDYNEALSDWTLTTADLEVLSTRSNIDFCSDQYRQLKSPSSLSFALILRLLGFENRIVVASADPPEIDCITRVMEEYQELGLTNPIDGWTNKKSICGDIWFANSIKNNRWDRKCVTGSLSRSLSILLE